MPQRARLLRLQWLLAVLTSILVVVWFWPFGHPFEGLASYAPLHATLETVSIVISMLVFGVAWNAYGRERSGNVIVIACALLATAIVDFVHVLSYAGMPDFITPSGPEKAINFWLAARLIAAVMLLTVAIRPWRPFTRPGSRHILLGGSLALAAAVIWIGLYRQDVLPRTFIPGRGLTEAKVAAEYGIIAILVVAAAIFLRRSRQSVPYDAPSLFAATVISILSELAFTLYTDVTDIFNLVGHGYKVVAYLFVYRAVFVESVREPFERAVKAETEMRGALAERARLVSAIEQAPALVMLTDAAHRIVYVNAAFEAAIGCGRAQVLGLDARHLDVSWDNEDGYREATAALSAGGAWSGVLTARRLDGSSIEEEVVVAPTADNRGGITGYVMVGRDVTRERALEGQLLQAQKMEAVGRLAGGVAHDFNNIINVIAGFAGLAADGLATDDQRHADLGQVLDAAGRATRLTQQLLAFSRQQVVEPRVFDLNDVVTEIEPMLTQALQAAIELTIIRGAARAAVRADRVQLEQVILNLAVNARDAMPTGGRLTIETASVEFDEASAREHVDVLPGPYVMLAMSDTGTGMDEATQARIFEPFFTTKPADQGTGLGLATTYGIVRQSGGFIRVHSELGTGTTFKVYLPRTTDPLDANGPASIRGSTQSGSETILLVEDDESGRRYARRVLEGHGYRVFEAASGAEALDVVARVGGAVDLLVTDVVLPGMGGPELAERLTGPNPGLPVLFISGYTKDAIGHNGILDAGTSYLAKPFSPNELTQKVREVLGKGHLG